jgi:hypothetical protein
MAEAFDAALRNRLMTINGMGSDATDMVRRSVQNSVPDWATGALAGNRPTMQNGIYNGPKGNRDALLAFGKMLQQRGFRVSENSMFNGGHRITSGHAKNSKHYSDRAIDVNRYPGTSAKEQAAIDAIVGLASQYGLNTIWRKPDHFNHAHFDY